MLMVRITEKMKILAENFGLVNDLLYYCTTLILKGSNSTPLWMKLSLSSFSLHSS